MNHGDGRFETHAKWKLASRVSSVSKLADKDGDGDLDFVGPYENGVEVLLNEGTGEFVSSARHPAPTALALVDIRVADIDGLGGPDIVVERGDWSINRNRIEVYCSRGLGEGKLRDARVLWAHAGRLQGIADVDGDGNTDLLIGDAYGPSTWGLLSHRGRVRFEWQSLPPRPSSPYISGTLRLVDADEDGDLDIIGWETLPAGSSPAVFWNDGTGQFPTNSWPLGGRSPNLLCAEDMDGDGDIDFCTATGDTVRAFLNGSRQLVTPWLARIGRPFRFDIHARSGNAPPGQLAVLFPSLHPSRKPVRLGKLGSFRLGFPLLATLPAVAIPAPKGMVSLEATIPKAPVLLALELCGQALVLHGPRPGSWRLTNLTRDRFVR